MRAGISRRSHVIMRSATGWANRLHTTDRAKLLLMALDAGMGQANKI